MHSVSIPKSLGGGHSEPAPDPRAPELRVTVAIGAAIIVQSALALIWAGAASERLAQLERRAAENAEMIERTARLEEQVRFMSRTVLRIEEKIDRAAGEAVQ